MRVFLFLEIMSDIQIFKYNGNGVTFRKGNSVMVNATEMAKPFGKLAKDWLSNKSTKEFISTLSAVRTIPLTELVVVKQGGNGEQGTWLHEDVAVEFARWLSPAFAIWCNDRIKELLANGSISIAQLSRKQLALMVVQAEEEKERLLQKIEADAPRVLFAEAVETSGSVCLVGELAKILKQNGIKDMGQNRLFEWLRSHCYLGNKGDNYNLPTQKAMDLGVFKVIKGKRIDKHTGGVVVTRTAKVTAKGLKYFINKFLNHAAVL